MALILVIICFHRVLATIRLGLVPKDEAVSVGGYHFQWSIASNTFLDNYHGPVTGESPK